MLPSEIEENVNELETRVDRLRALYEQYFMGIEKMEPHVARKDVDRRIQLLRREQIRNTAQRFRFQMILQRYNTYQTYWLRICREIEEGTYKRHLVRATQKYGDVAERALPKWHRKRFWKGDGQEKAEGDAAAANAANGAGANQLGDFDESELDAAFDSVVVAVPPPVPSAPAARRSSVPAAAAKPKAAPPPLPARARTASAPSASELEPTRQPSRPSPAAAASTPAPRSPAPSAPAASAAPAAAAGADATKEERMRELARRLSEKKAAAAAAPVAAPAPAPAAAPPAATPQRPAAPVPSPVAARPQAAAAAAPAAPAARPAAAPPPSARDLSDERMRQIYSELVETKRRQKESTAAVTYEAMVKTLRESSAKLKEKHAGRSVDFEVTVKDGKTILRPVVK